ncbi:Uncharacterised protein [uncultured archaeon]|nr:Uncharacterised protein [uncultured archaeon]
MVEKKPSGGFSKEELEAMKETLKERSLGDKEGEEAVREKINALPAPDRTMAKRLDAIIRGAAPSLVPKPWYGMPAYATRDGRIICFFQGASKFKARYATLGFSDKAGLDEGNMWPNSYALMKLTGAEEAKIAALVKKAVKG